jgi:hypothetical protein
MRLPILSPLLIAVALLGEIQMASAQSPYSYPWCAIEFVKERPCLVLMSVRDGMLRCRYTSWDECHARTGIAGSAYKAHITTRCGLMRRCPRATDGTRNDTHQYRAGPAQSDSLRPLVRRGSEKSSELARLLIPAEAEVVTAISSASAFRRPATASRTASCRSPQPPQSTPFSSRSWR